MMLTSDPHRPPDSIMRLPNAAAMTEYFCARLSCRNERPGVSGMNWAGSLHGRNIQGEQVNHITDGLCVIRV